MVCFSVIGTIRKVPSSINKPVQNFKKETSETLFIQKNRSVFWPGNFLEHCLSQYLVDCFSFFFLALGSASEDCLSHQ